MVDVRVVVFTPTVCVAVSVTVRLATELVTVTVVEFPHSVGSLPVCVEVDDEQ